MWRKSSFCNGAAACVEVAMCACDDHDEVVRVRDSKLGDASPVLTFTREEWREFLAGATAGQFDLAALAADAGDGSDVNSAVRVSEAAVAGEGAASVSL
jgi:hypothetical protein